MKKILLLSMMLCGWSIQAQGDGGNCPVVEEVNQSFCESQGSGNNFYRPAVQHLQASAGGEGILWYDTADSTEPLSQDEILVNGEDYYAGNASGSCEDRAVVMVTVNDSPNAGGTTFYSISINAEPIDLLEIYEPSILGAPEAGGTMDPPLASGSTVFDPAVDTGGQYSYTVESTNDFCSDDVSYIYITVEPESQLPGGDDEGLQNCPIVDFEEQIFCESQGDGNDFYLPAVAHLSASANGDDIVWYATATSEQSLSADEVLVNGEDYFAGNASGTCAERVRVVAVVHDSPNAGGTTFVTFCSESGPQDLLEYYNPSILGEADGGGWIEPPLQSGSTMFDPSVDLPGQYVYHVASTNEQCSDDSSFIYISVSEAATAGEDIEVNIGQFSDPIDLNVETGATVGADYSWEPPLASGTGYFDPNVDVPGEYVLTVFNEEGCEDDSATVIVNVGSGDDEQNCPIVESSEQEFCESQGTGNDYYRPSVAHLEATANGDEVQWFDTELSGEPLSPDELLVDGEDYWAGNASSTCSERQRVVAIVNDSPNAGGTTFITVNSTDAPFDVLDFYEGSALGAPDAGGVVEPALASGGTIFNPALDAEGQYTYTVSNASECPDDSSFFTVTFIEEGTDDQAQSSEDSSVDVAIYPNPSKGDVSISLEEGAIAKSLRIFDLNGNTVKSMTLESNSQLENLDLSFLRPSMYFAEIITDQGKVVKRIVKQ